MRRFRPVVGSLVLLAVPALVEALPAPSGPTFIAPTPAAGALVTSGTVSVRVDASCTFDTGSLAVSLNGTPIPTSQFLPFSACSGGRITSQTAVVARDAAERLDLGGAHEPRCRRPRELLGQRQRRRARLELRRRRGPRRRLAGEHRLPGRRPVHGSAERHEDAGARRLRHRRRQPRRAAAELQRRRCHARQPSRDRRHAARRRLPELRVAPRPSPRALRLAAASSTRSTRRTAASPSSTSRPPTARSPSSATSRWASTR